VTAKIIHTIIKLSASTMFHKQRALESVVARETGFNVSSTLLEVKELQIHVSRPGHALGI